MAKVKTLVVSATNAGTINGKKTSTIGADIDAAVNGLGVDVKGVSVSPSGSAFPDQVIVSVLYEGSSEEEESGHKKHKK